MASITRLGSAFRRGQAEGFTVLKTNLCPRFNYIRHPVQGSSQSRHASLTSQRASEGSKSSYFQVPKWVVYTGVSGVVFIYAILRLTDPGQDIAVPRNIKQEMQGVQACTEIHASDLDKWIKAHPSSIDDEHAIGWNKMFQDFTKHEEKMSEPARIEAENARQLANYTRREDNKWRSTKEKGKMSTFGGNKNIGDQVLEELGSDDKQSLSDNISARVDMAKKMFTKATKGRAFGSS